MKRKCWSKLQKVAEKVGNLLSECKTDVSHCNSKGQRDKSSRVNLLIHQPSRCLNSFCYSIINKASLILLKMSNGQSQCLLGYISLSVNMSNQCCHSQQKPLPLTRQELFTLHLYMLQGSATYQAFEVSTSLTDQLKAKTLRFHCWST